MRRVLQNHAADYLFRQFSDLQDGVKPKNQEDYDYWHRMTCGELISLYEKHGYERFCFGQGQKWINMAFKYIYVLGEDRVFGFGELYEFCHVPIDNILIKQLEKYGFPRPSRPWSRLGDYDEYLSLQLWIRKRFSLLPLDVEFLLWMGRDPAIEGEDAVR